MSERLPVVVAIPNYNMGQQLATLLPELVEEDYTDIFVLDDASTDGSHEVVEDFNHGSGITFVSRTENKGAGSARNLIIEALGYDAIIHFIDADSTLETERIAEAVQDVMPSEPVGFVGGMSLTPDGTQTVWNYGPRQSMSMHISARLQRRIESLITTNPEKARALRDRFSGLLEDWPDPLSKPVRRPVFWNVEQNLMVRSDVFTEIGGFDERLRESEILDLAIRLHNRGLKRYFDPAVSVRHKNEQNVREYNRPFAMLKAEVYISHKHGLKSWFFPDDKFKTEL